MDKLSCAVGFQEKEILSEIVETVHMLLFFVMILFILFVYLMVFLGQTFGKNWRKFEGRWK
jgi:Na+/H+ antiporter NhaC